MQPENELEDLVKPKKWEFKLAKKAKKKRKHHRHHRHHLDNKKRPKKPEASEESANASTASAKKKKIVIAAFDGLKELPVDTNQEDSDMHMNLRTAPSSSSGLLSMLPHPREDSKSSRSTNIFLPSNLHSAKNATKTEFEKANEVRTETQGETDSDSDDDYDSSDFFGLKASSETPQAPIVPSISDVPYGPTKPPGHGQVERRDDVAVEVSTSATAHTSGIIDDSEALHMIYSRDVEHHGGNVLNAAEAVENMVDVCVDQALGPNVQATLLKNLHNKSLAEASLSHLANLPKSKDAVNTVARRKHQITYLANVAVAREEQLAEQWSQNRHNKRMSAQRYGF